MRPGTAFLFAALFACVLPRLAAQGGPPMITDDPGTPGDGHWEINLAWTDQRTPGATEFGLPLLDANYGIGDRLQLNYQAPWVVLRDSGEDDRTGVGDSQLAVKWRFYDAGEDGWQASIYPRITFLTPGSASGRRGLADSNTTYLLPVEVSKNLGFLSVAADFGRTFSAAPDDAGWMGGICVGRDVANGVELDVEAHATTADQLRGCEVVADAGTRIDLSEHTTLLLSIGRDIRNTLGLRSSLLSFCGIQLRL